MKDWVRFALVAVAVFAAIAGISSLFFPPDVFTAAPVRIAAVIVCWPVAYWFVYYRDKKTLFEFEV